MGDETDPNDRQAEVGDVPDLDPAERLEQTLEQLEEDGVVGSERISFKTKKVSGVTLDEIRDILSRVEFDHFPVTVTIEHDGNGDYIAEFDYSGDER